MGHSQTQARPPEPAAYLYRELTQQIPPGPSFLKLREESHGIGHSFLQDEASAAQADAIRASDYRQCCSSIFLWATCLTLYAAYWFLREYKHMAQFPQDGQSGQNVAFFSIFGALL